jgi:predicted transcriptional regulator YheO
MKGGAAMHKEKESNEAILIQRYEPLVEALAEILGPDTEVLLHDVTTPEGSVIACRNAHITGRAVGSPMTAFGLKLIRADMNSSRNGVYNYSAHTEDGRNLKCSVIYIRSDAGALVGMICLNTDQTRAELASSYLRSLLIPGGAIQDVISAKPPRAVEETFYKGLDDVWSDLREQLRGASLGPIDKLSPIERERVIERLDNEGFFMVKGSVDVFAQESGKSRYTIYAQLRRIREKRGQA